MRIRPVLYIIGVINIFVALFMLAPLAVSVIFKDGDTNAILWSLLITAACGLGLYLIFRSGPTELNHRQGFLVVAIAWLDIGFFGALPFFFSGVFDTFVDAYFESVSGFTTTGASVLTSIAGQPHGILFWRSMTHWLGGMGIVVLSLAILPLLGVGGMQLYKAEGSIASVDKFVPRVTEMAKILWLVYMVMSFVMVVFLLMGGMGLYDAFIHAFGTLSTGGFSNQDMSVGHYNSVIIETIIVVFMFLGATNFTLHYQFYHKGLGAYVRNREFRLYFFLVISAIILVTLNLRLAFYDSISQSFRYAVFQVVSIHTTTGFSSVDFARWPALSQLILFMTMFLNGSAGSTSGGIKCMRILILAKSVRREIYRLIHPRAVIHIKLGGTVVSPEVVNGVVGFTFLYMLIFAVAALILAALGVDFVSAITASATTIGGIGPGLSALGPDSNYSAIPFLGKWILILNMLMGRLEIYTLIILFTPTFWRG